jgi:hypothetical protein
MEELSIMMFKKVNLRDRRWWLSTFYSLCIQSYVRRALLVIEQQLLAVAADDADLNSDQYLHLITVLFTAVSFQYDPLSTGRLQQAVADDTIPEASVPELYLASARTVCGVEMWAGEGIKSSYQFLTRMLNIGSLDSVAATGDIPMLDSQALVPPPTPLSPGSPCMPTPLSNSFSGSVHFSAGRPSSDVGGKGRPPTIRSFETIYSTPNSSLASLGKSSIWTQDTSITVPPCGGNSARRNSIGSILSIIPPPAAPALPPQPRHTDVARLPLLPSPSPYRKPQPIGGTNANGLVCGCCPKRPQTFQTAEELR